MNEHFQPRLPPGQQLAAPNKWPLIGERGPRPSSDPWTLTISGLVDLPTTFSLDQLYELPQTERVLDIHCVTRWSQYDMRFSGVLLSDLLNSVGVSTEARFISFVSRSTRNHSSSLDLNDALSFDTLIALDFNGQPLPVEHGGPIRNIVPGRYFYKSVKWLEAIELLSIDRLGFWEAESGYHNHADPWQEERYMAPAIDRRLAAELIAKRDFSGLDLRSIDCSLRELPGLNARGSALRDANFRDANLANSDFSEANLSNAHFQGANLQGAKFVGTDLEGANMSGANLCGVDLTGAFLTGTTFGESGKLPQIDSTTIIPENILAPLTPDQLQLVKDLLASLA